LVLFFLSVAVFSTRAQTVYMKDTPTDTGVEPNPDTGSNVGVPAHLGTKLARSRLPAVSDNRTGPHIGISASIDYSILVHELKRN
jgi:hypothetical protein